MIIPSGQMKRICYTITTLRIEIANQRESGYTYATRILRRSTERFERTPLALPTSPTRTKKVGIVVPVYNEEEARLAFRQQLCDAVSALPL